MLRRAGLRALIAATIVPACFASTQRKEESLVRGARELNDDIRWRRWEHVIEYMPREEAHLFISRAHEIGEDLAMADHEVTSIDFAAGSDKATVQVIFEWYSQRTPIMKKTTVEQGWEYINGRWKLTRQRRVRGDRLPLVPESMAAADGGADAGAPDAR